ncbi:MAG TPA: LLM class flavin-dependent oxidoreductase, partial [Acidimicrobiales bacterium]
TNSDRRYLSELCLPALEQGLTETGRDRSDVQVVVGGMVATGRDDAAVAEARARSRYMLGFLFSTPAYRRTLELHGWEDLGDQLRSMTKEGRWEDLEATVTDDVLDTVVAAGRYDELARVLGDRYADLADGVLLHAPIDPADDEPFAAAVEELQAV